MSERVVLVAAVERGEQEGHVQEYLAELEALSGTLGWTTQGKFYQRIHSRHPKTYIGTGKLEEIRRYVQAKKIQTVIFDNELSPTHLRNIQFALKANIRDRSSLILDIFKARAKTTQARCQVQLARSRYLLPRLTRMWSHLERQRGSTLTRGGAGEKEIETDRRRVRRDIRVLQKRLERIKVQNKTQRKQRTNVMRVALIGYTNVGKSTLMHALTRADVNRADQLFATVDTTVRRMGDHRTPVLLSDTIGFIRKLPHELIEAFETTLEELKEADLLLHVVDFSSAHVEEHTATVYKTLGSLRVQDKPIILVFNKTDKVHEDPLLHNTGEVNTPPNGDVTPHERSANLCIRYAPAHVVYTAVPAQRGIDELRMLIDQEARKKYSQRRQDTS